MPELWNPLTGKIETAKGFKNENLRTILPVKLAPNGSVFIVLSKPSSLNISKQGRNWIEAKALQSLEGSWQVKFDAELGGPSKAITFHELTDWSKHTDSTIKYFSGTAVYSKTFTWSKPASNESIFLDLGIVANIAEVKLNGINCGVAWTAPYRVEISKALKQGNNKLEIEVSNTWANRLIGDQQLPANKRITNTTAPFRLEGKPLLQAGLLGPVTINTLK